MRRRGAAPLALLAAGAVAAALLLALLAGSDSYTVRAEFDNAAGLRKHFAVKIAGAQVGQVTRVDLDSADRAIAVMRVDKSAGPIGHDARANIRSSNLLGEKYVDLEPGDVRDPAPSGALIPHTRTSTPTELDDLLDVLDQPTRFALAAFVSEQGRSLVGRGQDLAAMLERMPPALDQARALLAGLATDNRALGRLIDESDRILAQVGPQRHALGRLVASAGGALHALASRRRQLGATVRRAPSTIAQVRRSLVELQRAARPLGPAAAGLRVSAPALHSMLVALPPFAAAARPTLRTARAVGPTLDLLGRRGAPVVSRMGPLGGELARFAGAFDPATSVLDQGFPDLLGLMEGWARTIQNRDAAGHVFRVGVTLNNDMVNSLRRQFVLAAPRTPRSQLVQAPTLLPAPSSARRQRDPVHLPKPRLPHISVRSPRLSAGPAVSKLLDFLLAP